MAKPKCKVIALYEGSFCETLHEIKELYDKKELNHAVIVFSYEEAGEGMTVRNFFGSPNTCLGLLSRARYYIESFMEG